MATQSRVFGPFRSILTAVCLLFCSTLLVAGEENASLRGHWPLDEGQGTVAHDRSGHGHDGKLTGCTWLKNDRAAVLNFDPGQYVVIPHEDDLNIRQAFTISVWINLTEVGGEKGFVSKGRNFTSSGFSFLQAFGKLGLEMATAKKPGMGITGQGYQLYTQPVLHEKVWSFVAVTYDSRKGRVAFYLDGQPIEETAAEGEVVYQPKGLQENVDYPKLPVTLGTMSAHAGGYHQLNGFLREVKLFNRVLTGDEIQREYARTMVIRDFAVEREEDRFAKTLTCKLSANIKDEDSNAPLNCRIMVRGKERNYVPNSGICYGTPKNAYFYAAEGFEIMLPSGTVEIVATCGYEYEPAKTTVSLGDRETKSVAIRLQRRVNWPEKGWYCGDHHVHPVGHGMTRLDPLFGNTPDTAETGYLNACEVCRGEGLNFVNFLMTAAKPWHIGPAYSKLTHWEDFIGYSGFECVQVTGNHVCEVNRPDFCKTGMAKGIFCVMDVLDYLATNGAIGVLTHPYSGAVEDASANCVAREIPLGIALGKIPVWDVFSWGDVDTAIRDWYRYLNLGFKVAATAGTDTYLNMTGKPGSMRCYCKLGALTWPEVVNSYRQGRTFVTEGPLLLFTVNGKEIGDIIFIDRPATLLLHIEAFSLAGLEQVEIIQNGVTVKVLTTDERRLKTDLSLDVNDTCWLALKVQGKKGDLCGALALSSPVYVQVRTNPIKPSKDNIDYFVGWLEKYRAILPMIAKADNTDLALAAELLQNIDRAMAVYKSLDQSPRTWTLR